MTNTQSAKGQSHAYFPQLNPVENLRALSVEPIKANTKTLPTSAKMAQSQLLLANDKDTSSNLKAQQNTHFNPVQTDHKSTKQDSRTHMTLKSTDKRQERQVERVITSAQLKSYQKKPDIVSSAFLQKNSDLNVLKQNKGQNLTAREAIEVKYERLIEKNMRETKEGKRTRVNLSRRHQQLLKEKQEEIQQLENKVKLKQFKRQRTLLIKQGLKKMPLDGFKSQSRISDAQVQDSLATAPRLRQSKTSSQIVTMGSIKNRRQSAGIQEKKSFQNLLPQRTDSAFQRNFRIKEQHKTTREYEIQLNKGRLSAEVPKRELIDLKVGDEINVQKFSQNISNLTSQDIKGSEIQIKKKKLGKRSTSQPVSSMLDELTQNSIKFKIPDSKHTTLRKNYGSESLLKINGQPTKLQVTEMVKTSPRYIPQNLKHPKPNVDDIEEFFDERDSNLDDDDAFTRKPKKVLRLAKQTHKQNQFLTQLQNQVNKVEQNSRQQSYLDQLGIKPAVQGSPMTGRNKESNSSILDTTDSVLQYSQTVTSGQRRQPKLLHTTFENQLKDLIIKNASRGKYRGGKDFINKKIQDLIQQPEMIAYNDFASTSWHAVRNEMKSILYELGDCVNKNLNIFALESNPVPGQDCVKNEGIELIPRLPIHCKVNIKERVAPLKLKFEFFDSKTQKKLKKTDCIVCVSPTVQQPTIESCMISKTDFKEPYITLYREFQGKTFPEFNPLVRNSERFPQQVYLSMQSLTGCFCTVSVSFPHEKKFLQNKQLQKQQTVKVNKVFISESMKQDEYFKHFQEIDEDETVKHNSHEMFRRHKKFVQDEIKRVQESKTYNPEVIRVAESLKKKRIYEQNQRREAAEKRRLLDQQKTMDYWIEKQAQMIEQSKNSSDSQHASDSFETNERPQKSHDLAKKSYLHKSTANLSKRELLIRQQQKREMMQEQAKHARESAFAQKQRLRQFLVFKQMHIRDWKQKQLKICSKQKQEKDRVYQWNQLFLLRSTIRKVYQRYIDFKKRSEQAQLRIAYATKLVIAAQRFFTNSYKQWGRTYHQRIQTKISTSMLHLYFLRNDHAETTSRQRMLHFLRAVTMRITLKLRMRKTSRAVDVIKRNCKAFKRRFVVREALLQAKIHQLKDKLCMLALTIQGKSINNLLLAKDIKQIKMVSQKLESHEHILQKNIKLFAKMIKYEIMLRKIRRSIVNDQIEETRQLRLIEYQMHGMKRTNRLNGDLDESFDESLEESSSEEDQKNLTDPETEVSFDRQTWKRLKTQRNMKLIKLKKLSSWQQSSYLKKIQHSYDETLKKVCKLRSDRSNLAALCFQDIDGYDDIQRQAKAFKTHYLRLRDQKKGTKQAYKIHLEAQATNVKRAFIRSIEDSKNKFERKLKKQVKQLNTVIDNGEFGNDQLTRSSFQQSARTTKPEEIAFLFIKTMDEIYMESKNQDLQFMKKTSTSDAFSSSKPNNEDL